MSRETEGAAHLEPLLVQYPAPVKLAQLELELDVLLEELRAGERAYSQPLRWNAHMRVTQQRDQATDLLLGRHADRHTEDLARRVEVLLAHLELGKLDPHLCEREALVRHELEARAVDLARALQVLPNGRVSPMSSEVRGGGRR